MRKPDGSKVVASRASDGSGGFEFTDTLEPGVYTVLRSDQETRVGLFAVNLDSYESDLSYLDESLTDENANDRNVRMVAELKDRLGQPPLVSYVDDPAMLTDVAGGSGRALKLWDLILFVVLLVGLLEPWLANQISRRLYGRPGTPPLDLGPLGKMPSVMAETARPAAEGVAR